MLSRQAANSAAYAVAQEQPTAADAAHLAKVCALDAEFEANRVSLQMHGGIGFTWEHDLQFWLKRGKALEQAYGRASAVRREAGRAGLQTANAAAI
jgi:alkylation response protein AidB-like acyl-CoA dehydrogenase